MSRIDNPAGVSDTFEMPAGLFLLNNYRFVIPMIFTSDTRKAAGELN